MKHLPTLCKTGPRHWNGSPKNCVRFYSSVKKRKQKIWLTTLFSFQRGRTSFCAHHSNNSPHLHRYPPENPAGPLGSVQRSLTVAAFSETCKSSCLVIRTLANSSDRATTFRTSTEATDLLCWTHRPPSSPPRAPLPTHAGGRLQRQQRADTGETETPRAHWPTPIGHPCVAPAQKHPPKGHCRCLYRHRGGGDRLSGH